MIRARYPVDFGESVTPIPGVPGGSLFVGLRDGKSALILPFANARVYPALRRGPGR